MIWTYLLFPITILVSMQAHSRFLMYYSILLYVITVFVIFAYFPQYSVVDISGLRIDGSAYLAIISAMFLLLLLYLGNILSLALASTLKTNPTPSIILTSTCTSILFNNCLLIPCIFSGWHLYTSILISSTLSSLSQSKKLKLNLSSLQTILIKFFESTFQGFFLIMTGSSLSCWFISVSSSLLSYPFYTELTERNRIVEGFHYLSALIFGYLIGKILNPYHFNGVFYRVYADFHFV